MSVSYEDLLSQARGLLSAQAHRVANAANLSALIYHGLDRVNWAGFYFLEGDELIVGPFQGQPACVRIPMGKGVCGTAAATLATQRVADVHAFEGHIACDAASRSEIVVPLLVDGQLIGVLDIDSPVPDRFSEADQAGIEALAKAYTDSLGGTI
ncbi:GAF domain-containing protein [Wenzhouxiangella marina]|uniref:Diguanylate cyclase n=1 Tax=Wenzhouxiangella marina TaxID=1579979 RepID=A0A0K0XYY3_9GAMM|nr:GAF domain-containing protein [Wenzhouxiangella marina]AKS42837.1 diguanylate cyclase [Wenzhouxiangella marina]MBB6087482.1 GAF domain-containing protein [Wenzhouxiangella marina]